MSQEKNASKLDAALKLGLVMFISLLSFAVGTFVGKKFSDNHHKMAKFEQPEKSTVTAQSNTTADATTVGSADKESLSDDEIAKLAEEFVAEENLKKDEEAIASGATRAVASTTATEPASNESAGHAPAAEKSAEKSNNEKVADKSAEKQAEKTTEKKSEVSKVMDSNSVSAAPAKADQKIKLDAPSSNLGKYTVQIASYPSEGEAQKMSAGLKDKGIPAFYITAKVKDQTWYRVSVGLFETSSEAEEQKKKLDKDGITKTIVQKITN